MSNPFENYTTAAVAQENWEKRQGYRTDQSLTLKEKAKKQLEAELYSLQHEYPDSDREAYYNKLFQFAWVEEMDEIFDDLEIVVDEIVANNIDV